MNIEALRFPIGPFKAKVQYAAQDIAQYIAEIENLPARLKALVSHFSEQQLETQYRPGGWTVRQVIHHLPDSHSNGLIRFKLALTEENPTIKPYLEHLWAELPDGKSAPIALSLDLLAHTHTRWVYLLKRLNEKDFQREYFHPEHGKSHTLAEAVAQYAWHGEHHFQHINQLKIRENW